MKDNTSTHILEDKELGTLIVQVNPRARRFVFRTKSDAIYVSIPPGTTRKELDDAIESLRDKLLHSRQKVAPSRRIDLNYHIHTEFFKLTLVQGNRKKFLAHSELGEMKIICPPDADFDDPSLQEWLQKVIEEGLRRNAKIILPPRLYMLSNQHDLPYKSIKINSSKGRWGSCSARANINLSYYLVLLPLHLIDYVLLHELCHTREMNHGEKFWALMDKITDGNAQKLRRELKEYKTNI